MIRGVRFKIPNEFGSFLRQIFDGIAVENYFWRLRDNDTFASPIESFFSGETYSGLEFKKMIERDNYYIVHLGLFAFPKKSDEEIYDYSSYLSSSAKLFLQITDCEFVDIYVKEEETLALLHEAAKKHEFTQIKFFTEENARYNEDLSAMGPPIPLRGHWREQSLEES